MSLYWATATTTTVGYGDIRAHTHTERMYATVIMVYGVVAYGYLIASVAANLVNADAGRAQYQAKLITVKSYLKVSFLKKKLVQVIQLQKELFFIFAGLQSEYCSFGKSGQVCTTEIFILFANDA